MKTAAIYVLARTPRTPSRARGTIPCSAFLPSRKKTEKNSPNLLTPYIARDILRVLRQPGGDPTTERTRR